MSDLISREETIKYFFRPYSNEEAYTNVEIEKILLAMPSAEKTGKWIKKYRGHFSCSVCGAWYKTTDEYGNIIDGDDEMKSNNYCSNCGAKME